MAKIAEIKFTKEDVLVMDKIAKVNDKVMIDPDKIQAIDGTNHGDGSANNKFAGGNKTVMYNFEIAHTFIDSLGICNLPSLLNVVKTISNNFKDESPNIEVHEKFLVIKDGSVNYKFYLTPKETKIIPECDVEKIRDYVVLTNKPHAKFKMEGKTLNSIFTAQRIINSFNTFFSLDGDRLKIKVSDSFDETGVNSANVYVEADKIEVNTLHEAEMFDYNIFDQLRSDFIVSDDYTCYLSEKAIALVGDKSRTFYFIKANFK